jgi:TolB-like protein
MSRLYDPKLPVKIIVRFDVEMDIGEIDRGKDVHFDRASMAQLGKLQGVQVAVQGSFQRAGNTVRVVARFVRVDTGEVLDVVTRDGAATPPPRLLKLQDDVAELLHARLVALAKARPADLR